MMGTAMLIFALACSLAWAAYSTVELRNATKKLSEQAERLREHRRKIIDLRTAPGIRARIADYGDRIEVSVFFVTNDTPSGDFKVVRVYEPKSEYEHALLLRCAEMLATLINEQT